MAETKTRQFVNEKKIAEMSGIPSGTLRQWRAQGVGPKYYKPMGRVLYDVEEVVSFIEASRHVPSVRENVEQSCR